MESMTVCTYRIPVPGTKPVRLFQIADTHLACADSLSDPEEKALAEKQTAAWERVRPGFPQKYGEPFGKERQIPAFQHYVNLMQRASEGDAVVMCGDIMDYVSGGNLRAAEHGIRECGKPFIAVCGNHEDPGDIPQGCLLSGMRDPVQTLQVGDFQIIGVDDSRRTVTKAMISHIDSLLSSGRKTVIAMHTPVMNTANRDILTRAGAYYALNYDGCPESTAEFIDLITDGASPVVAVLTGHLHFGIVTPLREGLYQYGVSQGIAGNMNEFILGGEA